MTDKQWIDFITDCKSVNVKIGEPVFYQFSDEDLLTFILQNDKNYSG